MWVSKRVALLDINKEDKRVDKKIIYLFVTTLAVTAMVGCGSSDEQVYTEETTIENVYNASDDNKIAESNSLASAETSIETDKADETVSEISDSLSADASIENTESDETNTGVSTEETEATGYSIEDIQRLYANYIQSELTNVDVSKIEIDVWFSEDLYWVDTFQDNETDSMHQVKSGSAYIDPITGKGKFWIWGWYDDPDAVDVDFSAYDY